MIIKKIKYRKGFFFGKDKLVIITDKGKSILEDFNADKKEVEKLDSELKEFKINNLDDFKNFCNILNKFNFEKKSEIELGILNFSGEWKLIDAESKQIPRPIVCIFNKDVGLRKIYLLSLNANDFQGVVNACREVSIVFNKKLEKIKKYKSDEEILLIAKEAVDEVYKEINFELRIGAGFDNFLGGVYLYDGFSYGHDEQFDNIKKLIENYNLVYVENAFSSEMTEYYKKLTDNFKDKCLICFNYENYSENIKENIFNACVLDYNSFEKFNNEINILRENKINIIIKGDVKNVNISVGFKIQMMQIENLEKADPIAGKFSEISNQMKNF